MATGNISLEGLDKGDVLAALYNASRPQGMGFFHYDPKPMTREEAQDLLKRSTDFDYLKGRVMKIDLSGEVLDTTWYNRDNGPEAAEKAIASLRASGATHTRAIEAAHREGTREAAREVKAHLGDKSSIREEEGTVVYHLGLDYVAPELNEAVDEALKK